MGFFETFSLYKESIFVVSICFGISVFIFSFYKKKYICKDIVINRGITKESIFQFMWRIVATLPVALMASCRGWITGADTHNVWIGYIRCGQGTLEDAITYDLTSSLYNVFRWSIFKITSGNVQVFLFLLAFLTVYFVVLSIEKWDLQYSGFALYIFYMCFGLQILNQSRQLLAVALFLYAYYDLFNKNYKKFFTISFLAGLLHVSVLPICLVVWVLLKRKEVRNSRILYWIMLILVCISMPVLISIVGKIVFDNTKYMYLVEAESSSGIGMGLILTLIPTVIPIILFGHKLNRDNGMRDIIYMVLPMRLAGYYSYYVYRLFYFFGVINVIAFPLIVERTSKRNKGFYAMAIFLCCLIYFIVYYCWLMAEVFFPYVTFWESGWYGY